MRFISSSSSALSALALAFAHNDARQQQQQQQQQSSLGASKAPEPKSMMRTVAVQHTSQAAFASFCFRFQPISAIMSR